MRACVGSPHSNPDTVTGVLNVLANQLIGRSQLAGWGGALRQNYETGAVWIEGSVSSGANGRRFEPRKRSKLFQGLISRLTTSWVEDHVKWRCRLH